MRRHAFAPQCPSPRCQALPLPRGASLCCAGRCFASPLLCEAGDTRCDAMPLRCSAVRCSATAEALLRLASLRLRFGGVSEATLPAVTPLPDAAVFPIVQPLFHDWPDSIIQELDLECELAAGGRRLAVSECDAFTLRAGGAQRSLAIAHLSLCLDENLPRVNEDRPIDHFPIRFELSGFCVRHARQHPARIFHKSLDLVIPDEGRAFLSGKDRHAAHLDFLGAMCRDFFLARFRIGRLRRDEFSVQFWIRGRCAEEFFDECDCDWNFHAFEITGSVNASGWCSVKCSFEEFS